MFGKRNIPEFIKLHCPQELFFRTSEILVMRWYEEEAITKISSSSGRCWIVYETPDEVLKLMGVEK